MNYFVGYVIVVAVISIVLYMYLEGSEYKAVKKHDKFIITKNVTFLSPEYWTKPNVYSSSKWQRNINKAILFDTKEEAEQTIRKIKFPDYF